MAKQMGSPQGIAYRYGPDSRCWHATAVVDPQLYRPPHKVCQVKTSAGTGFLYQLGQCLEDPGDYSSAQGVALWASDTPSYGVDLIQIYMQGHGGFEYRPQVSYTWGTSLPPHFAQPHWVGVNGGALTAPVAVARSSIPSSSANNHTALVAFSSGLIGPFGSNTSDNYYASLPTVPFKLPASKSPTAIAITNSGEFALVTVWDTDAHRGQLAVIALDGKQPNANLDDTHYCFHESYPGFMNCGTFTFMKLLGFVDLPGMAEPTEISASSNRDWGSITNRAGKYPFPMSSINISAADDVDRKSFMAGGANANTFATSGLAVVVSKSERKAIFIDLEPLFAFYRTMYFGTRADFDRTRDIGTDPAQWPFAFSKAPESAPVIVKTVDIGDAPTAVYVGRYGNPDVENYIGALVATRDGTLQIYDVGGLANDTPATASAIKVIGTAQVGHNPTSIAPRRSHGYGTADAVTKQTGDPMHNEVIVTSRGDREIEFVRIAGGKGTVYKRLRDASLLDPIAAEDVHQVAGTELYVVTVADYGGKRVSNYRYGPVFFRTNGNAEFGMGADGRAEFELGGTFATQGGAFAVSGANVP